MPRVCWADVCFAPLPTLVVCHCSELLSLPGVFSAANNKVGTSVHIHQLSQTLPKLLCHFQCCPATSLPQQGLELFSFWQNGKRNWAWPLQNEKMSDLWGTALLMSHLCFSVPSQGKQCHRLPRDSRGWPYRPKSVSLAAVRVTGRGGQPQIPWNNYGASSLPTLE